MIKIPIKHLKPAVAGLAKLGLSRATLPVLRCIRVDASPTGVGLTGTDLAFTARIDIPEINSDADETFLVPFDRLQSLSRRLPADACLGLESGKFTFDLGSNSIVEEFEAPASGDFPDGPHVSANPAALPETFGHRFREALQCTSHDQTRNILNGVALDLSGTGENGHYLVATDGRQLFSANSFHLPISQSVIVPNHKFLSWQGLSGIWAIAMEAQDGPAVIRLTVGDWTLAFRAIDGNYPNWRQVLVHDHQVHTRLTFPEKHSYNGIIQALAGGGKKEKPVDIVVSDGTVAVKDAVGGAPIQLVDVEAKGPDVSIRLNRSYLTRALGFGLNQVGIVDAMSPLRFTREGRTFVVMPLRVAAVTSPAPAEPQPERKTMPETNGARPREEVLRVASTYRSPETPAEEPALEAAIDKLDAFKNQFKETLTGLNELTSLLRQAVRDQKAGEKEIQTVRQTLRSLQSVRI